MISRSDPSFVVTRTPLRVSLFGGGSDLPSYYERSGRGAVLSFAISQSTYVTVKHHTEFFDERYRLNYAVSEAVSDMSEIKNNIVRETLRSVDFRDHAYISTIADLPSGNGLGSSSSFCVGLLQALHAMGGHRPAALDLAEQACHIEIDRVGSPIGKQDQYAVALGGVNRIEFLDHSAVIATRVPNGLRVLEALSDSLIMVWTGRTRDANQLLGVQKTNNAREQNIMLLDGMVRLADQAFDHFCRGTIDARILGEMLHEGWSMKRQLTDSVSTPGIDHMYEEARRHGAIGGKVLGAGGGGFLLLVFSPERRLGYVEALAATGIRFLEVNPTEAGSEVLCQAVRSGP